MSNWTKTAFVLCAMTAAWPAAAQAPAATPSESAAPAPYQQMATPAGAKLYIISPANKARVRSPFTVQFGLKGMGVTQAGNTSANAGHHHLLVDVKEPISETEIIPSDKNHLHFGGGQTETTLDLPPGRHTLQLVLGDAKHRPLSPLLASQKIEVTVVSPTAKKKKHRRPGHYHY
ncbi:hypothetical protein Msil_2123 [Methylocella silvestris BL2]|uniref:DUF4399 domain-containing protein n=1 Tax=Methylocella silvestris (strain DSM 15510 / CIP 108128 / LMG 27833 / NCIMB 13906 / BL2) TaxID=395965 RepID=B8ERL0_METSB|nr:DUF4399 domain-containing protein [Methylocella silvestris]ACK51062.1 hypothetical protein Msil_2123 [Methylocella silvestris BL2]